MTNRDITYLELTLGRPCKAFRGEAPSALPDVPKHTLRAGRDGITAINRHDGGFLVCGCDGQAFWTPDSNVVFATVKVGDAAATRRVG